MASLVPLGAERLDGREIRQVKRYEMSRLIGEGGMGWVYQAYDPVLERDVALKIMKGDVPRAERLRFRREAIFGARFCHPSIVRVFDMGAMPAEHAPGDTEWFSMEFLPGVDMEEVVLKKAIAGERAPLRSVGEVFRQVLGGLQYAHDCGVVHRDIKPANIFVARDPNTQFVTSKLLDFGVALDLDGPKKEDWLCGDPRYMAPEQTRIEATISTRADIYAAGMSLFEILAGRHPFHDLEGKPPRTWIRAQRERKLPKLGPELAPGTDPELARDLETIVTRACDKRPERRFESAREMQRSLLDVVERHAAAVPMPASDAPIRRNLL